MMVSPVLVWPAPPPPPVFHIRFRMLCTGVESLFIGHPTTCDRCSWETRDEAQEVADWLNRRFGGDSYFWPIDHIVESP